METTDYETEARVKKAAKLAATLHKAHATAATAECLSDEAWELAALVAGVRPPSETTKRHVIRILDALDEAKARSIDLTDEVNA